MAQHHQPSVLIEHLIEELRKVLQRWNTSCLSGKLIIAFENKKLIDVQYHPSGSTLNIGSDLPSELPQKLSHHESSIQQGQSFQRSKNTSDNCNHNFSYQLCHESLPRCCSQDNLVSEKSRGQVFNKDEPTFTSQSTLPFPGKHWSPLHDQTVSSQFTSKTGPISVLSHHDSAPFIRTALPPFEKIMQAKSSHSVQNMLTSSGQEYEENSVIETLPQTCYNDVHYLQNVTAESSQVANHMVRECMDSLTLNSNRGCEDKNEVSNVSRLVNSSSHDARSFVEEMNIADNYQFIPECNLPQGQSSTLPSNKRETTISAIIDAFDLTKLSRNELIKIVAKVLYCQDVTERVKSAFSSHDRSKAQDFEHVSMTDFEDKIDSKECFPSKIPSATHCSIDSSKSNPLLFPQAISETDSNFKNREVTEVNIEDGLKATSKDIEFREFVKSVGSLASRSPLNQNVKPLKKRARSCTSSRTSEICDKSQDEEETEILGDTECTHQHLPDLQDINRVTDQKEKRTIKGEKVVKNGSFTCKICLNNFTSRYDYRQHLRSHDGSFKCNVCGKIMKTKDSLYHHQRGLHSNEKPYHCKDCAISFNFHHSYKLHLQRHRGERPHKCKCCDKSYLTLNHLKEHVHAIHSNACIVCHVCGKRFSYPSALKLHLHRHSGELPFKCPLCPKTFSTKQALKIHGISHIKDRNFQCETCGKCFKTEYSRNFHSKKHKKQSKRFMCDVCGKTFLYRCILNSHVQIHSKLRPYGCKMCDKTFKSKASLYTHKYNVHKEGLMFSCTICSKSFKTKSCLTAHLKRHQNDIIYTCSTCGATFPDKGGLNKHMKTIHLPHKCFICKICGKTGTRADNMRTHVKSHKNEVATFNNPMEFIIEELTSNRLNEFQNQPVKVRQRSREPKHQSTRKLYPVVQTSESNRWTQPCPSLLKYGGKNDAQLQATASTISVLPLNSQGSIAGPLNDIGMNNPSHVLSSQSSKNFETYIPNDQNKSSQFFSYLCPSDTASSSGNSANNLTLPTSPLTTLLSTIN